MTAPSRISPASSPTRPPAGPPLVRKLEVDVGRARLVQNTEADLAIERSADLRAALLRELDPVARDRRLSHLVVRARDDPEAAAVLVYCLLPGLRVMARRFAGQIDEEDLWSELVASLLGQIRRYDLGRRPERIAANLLLDTLSRTCRWVARERRAVCEPLPEGAACSRDTIEEGPLAEALRRGVISRLDASLIHTTRVDGMSLAVAARLLGLTYEAAKKRRRRAELVLVDWWDPALVGGTERRTRGTQSEAA